eukprot:881437-Amphidinium_carterae.1
MDSDQYLEYCRVCSIPTIATCPQCTTLAQSVITQVNESTAPTRNVPCGLLIFLRVASASLQTEKNIENVQF